MLEQFNRREFLHVTAAGGALYLAGSSLFAARAHGKGSKIISPGCRGSKVKVARIYMGTDYGLWPTPKLSLRDEIRSYEAQFARFSDELSDVDFVVDELVKSVD